MQTSRSGFRKGDMLISPVIPSLASAITVMLVCGWLYFAYREQYLLIWAVAWSLWVVRYGYALALDQVTLLPSELVLPLLVLLRSGFILWGSQALTGRPLPRTGVWLVAVAAVWALADLLLPFQLDPFGVDGLAVYAVFSGSLVWAGWLFLMAEPKGSPEMLLGGFALMAFGLLQLTFPLQGVVQFQFGATGYTTATVLQSLIGFAVVLAFTRRATDESGALVTLMQEHVPICAHCKSIREGKDQWTRVEHYVSRRTGSTLSHGVCPGCFERHYADDLRALERGGAVLLDDSESTETT